MLRLQHHTQRLCVCEADLERSCAERISIHLLVYIKMHTRSAAQRSAAQRSEAMWPRIECVNKFLASLTMESNMAREASVTEPPRDLGGDR